MKKINLLLVIITLGIAAIVINPIVNPKVQESITFFPIDPKVTFITAQTSLSLENHQALLWKIDSVLDRKAYLRQDAGFLFANGRLTGELGNWKQNTAKLIQEKKITLNRSTLFQAITFHHAELHEEGDQIFSSQAMSQDHLYVIAQVPNSMSSFRVPKTKKQTEWKQKLDEQTEKMLQYSWNRGVRHFSIRLNDYQAYPLNQFNIKANNSLPGFTKEETAKIVGRLWEGLYKNYFLGIKKQDGTGATPIGSTLPLILLANNKSHLLVLTETANGEPILLRQRIEAFD